MHDLRSESSSQSRKERINRAVYYNMADGEENMSVQGDGLEEYRVPDEDMPAASSSSSGRSRIVADYEGRIQQQQAEHENELRFRDTQEAKRIDMIPKKG